MVFKKSQTYHHIRIQCWWHIHSNNLVQLIISGQSNHKGFDTQPTASGIYEVIGEALRVAPGLAQAELKTVRVGLRPMIKDQLPILSRVPYIDNLYLATGHGSTGLLLGPYSGKIMSQMMLDQCIETDIIPFAVERFM